MTILWDCCWKTCPITSFLAFGFQKHAFNINHITVCLSEISSGLSVRAYDPVAGNIGCERVFLQGLTYSLRTWATYAACKFSIGDGLTGGYIQEFQIYFLLELCDFPTGSDFFSDARH